MDVLLTRTARRALEAAALGGGRTASGLLLGHKRGGRFVIESAVPSGRGSFPGREAYVRLASILGDEVVGFFSSPPAPGLPAFIISSGLPAAGSSTVRAGFDGVRRDHLGDGLARHRVRQ